MEDIGVNMGHRRIHRGIYGKGSGIVVFILQRYHREQRGIGGTCNVGIDRQRGHRSIRFSLPFSIQQME